MGKKKLIVPKNVKEFANAKFKVFKKQEGDYASSKKELYKMYHLYITEFLPDTIEFLIRFGHMTTLYDTNIKDLSYKKLTDPDYVKFLQKQIKKKGDRERLINLPILLSEIVSEAQRVNSERLKMYEEEKEKASDTTVVKEPEYYDVSYITELSEAILSKKIKKFTKNGIPKALAFDILSIIPDNSVMRRSTYYRIREFMTTLYAHSLTTENQIDFNKIIDLTFEDKYKPQIITFALLERKDKFSKLTDKQKELYLAISSWCFSTLESMKKDDIEDVLNTYTGNRANDKQAGKDSARRYSLISLPKEDYPRINKVIERMSDESKKELL